MKVLITKENNGYSLTIRSGHFSGILENIPEENLKELRDSLASLLESKSSEYTLTWNPRSKRLEKAN